MTATPSTILTHPQFPGLPHFKSGKVREVFDFDDTLLFVATDRVSAFDYILPNGIPDKGRILTQISKFWFEKTKTIMPNHFITDDIAQFPKAAQVYAESLTGRAMLVKKTKLIEIECVIRGYIAGSGWKDYQQTGQICGHQLPSGLQLADRLPEPLFTPATKAESGHDENISVSEMRNQLGDALTQELMDKSLRLYQLGHDYAKSKGIILADTKFEFGIDSEGTVILIDEVLTPDSSRYWPADSYRPGISPPSFDKQIIRDYLESIGWNKQPPVPQLPDTVITKVSNMYNHLFQTLV